MRAQSPVDWSQVRATAAATGSLAEAARRHGASLEATKKRAQRGKWETPATLRKVAAVAQSRAIIATTNAAITDSQIVPIVPVPAGEAIERHMAEHRDSFRTNIATALSKAAKHAAGLEPDQILEKSRKVADIAQAGSKLHGLGQPETQVAVQVLNSW